MRTLIVLVAAAVALAGCGHKKRARVTPPPGPSRRPVVVQPGDTEEGLASWYGHPYHGRAAADGEIYDMEKMTAAHRTLPFHTWVRVYDLDNNRSVDVRITDRGPFVAGRIIDLSHAAARELSMIGPGVARVFISVPQPRCRRAPPRPRSVCRRSHHRSCARRGARTVDDRPGRGARAHRSHRHPAGRRWGAVRGSGGRFPRPRQRRAPAQSNGGSLWLGASGRGG